MYEEENETDSDEVKGQRFEKIMQHMQKVCVMRYFHFIIWNVILYITEILIVKSDLKVFIVIYGFVLFVQKEIQKNISELKVLQTHRCSESLLCN